PRNSPTAGSTNWTPPFAGSMVPKRQHPIARRWKRRWFPVPRPLRRRFVICVMSEGGLMPIEITVPRLGWTMEEGTFVGWLKKEGDLVRAGEPLFTLDGDKALQEIEASESGVLRIPGNAPSSGSTVRVGDVLGYLVASNEPTAP